MSGVHRGARTCFFRWAMTFRQNSAKKIKPRQLLIKHAFHSDLCAIGCRSEEQLSMDRLPERRISHSARPNILWKILPGVAYSLGDSSVRNHFGRSLNNLKLFLLERKCMSNLDTLIEDLVIANRILTSEGIVDAFGH